MYSNASYGGKVLELTFKKISKTIFYRLNEDIYAIVLRYFDILIRKKKI
jgi:hypothetical protein